MLIITTCGVVWWRSISSSHDRYQRQMSEFNYNYICCSLHTSMYVIIILIPKVSDFQQMIFFSSFLSAADENCIKIFNEEIVIFHLLTNFRPQISFSHHRRNHQSVCRHQNFFQFPFLVVFFIIKIVSSVKLVCCDDFIH